MALQPFTWGAGGRKITSPEQAERQRAIAQALIGQNATPAKNWAEGLADVTGVWAGMAQEDRVAQAEEEGRQRAGGLFANLALESSPDAIMQALISPDAAWASDAQTSIASALLDQGMKRSDPMYQLQLEQAQLELENLRNPALENPYMNVGGGSVFNQATGEFIQAPGGAQTDLPADIQEYQWYADAETVAGRVPLSYLDFVNAQKGGGLQVTTNPDGTTTIQQGGPAFKPTEGQGKDMVYVSKGAGALPEIDALEKSLTSFGEAAAGSAPMGLGNFVQSEEYQRAQRAGKEFVAAILRKETGAAVTPSEEQMYGDMYLPRPGDKPGTLAAKRAARARALKAIGLGLPAAAILSLESQGVDVTGGGDPNAAVPLPGTAPGAVIDWTEL